MGQTYPCVVCWATLLQSSFPLLCGDDDLQAVCYYATLDVSFGTRETAVSNITNPLAQ
jgi:hypothetical protein